MIHVIVLQIDEIISSTPQSPDANENEPTTSSEEKTQFVELPDKFLEFLDRIAPKDFSFGEKLNFLMKTYDQNSTLRCKKLKLGLLILKC